MVAVGSVGGGVFSGRFDSAASQALGEPVVGGGVVLPRGGCRELVLRGVGVGRGAGTGGPGGRTASVPGLCRRMWLTAGAGSLAIFELCGGVRPWLGAMVFRLPLSEVSRFEMKPGLLSYRLLLGIGSGGALELEVQRGVGAKRQLDRIAALVG